MLHMHACSSYKLASYTLVWSELWQIVYLKELKCTQLYTSMKYHKIVYCLIMCMHLAMVKFMSGK